METTTTKKKRFAKQEHGVKVRVVGFEGRKEKKNCSPSHLQARSSLEEDHLLLLPSHQRNLEFSQR